MQLHSKEGHYDETGITPAYAGKMSSMTMYKSIDSYLEEA